MRYFFVFGIISSLFCCSCGSPEKENSKTVHELETDTLQEIRNDFKNNALVFTKEDVELSLLRELGFCGEDSMLVDTILCSSKFFQFDKLFQEVALRDAFILTVNGELYDDKTSAQKTNRVLVYVREKRGLVQTNAFKGSIKEFIGSKDPKSIILEFNYSKDDVYFYCQFDWIKGKFQFDNCQRISYDRGVTQHFVKEEEKANVSKDVEQIIVSEKFMY